MKKIIKQVIKNKFYLKAIRLVCMLLAFLFLCPHSALASFFYLSTSNINIEENIIKLDLYINIKNIDEVKKTIKDGASIEISCKTDLLRKQIFFSDINLENISTIWLLQYDPLTREFLLSKNTKLVKRDKDINKLVDSIFFPLEASLDNKNLEAKISYSIDVHINLRQAQIPAWIEKTLFFWDWNLMSASYSFEFVLPDTYGLIENYEVIDAT